MTLVMVLTYIGEFLMILLEILKAVKGSLKFVTRVSLFLKKYDRNYYIQHEFLCYDKIS